MAELLEHFREQHPEAFGRILGPGPAGGVEQFVGGRSQFEQVLRVSTAAAINRRMKLQKNLVPPADVTDGEARAVMAERETLLEAGRKSANEQGVVGDLIVEPIGGEIELPGNVVRRGQQPLGQRSRRDQTARINSGENIDILRGGATDQPQGEQGRTAAHDEMLRRLIPDYEELSQKAERPVQHICTDLLHSVYLK
ncbi:MAG TPA: hypothetical protein VHE61_15405 [Opitutaceae bacterium]|nr:hypothetical protein [Opitutaceae bacterium]